MVCGFSKIIKTDYTLAVPCVRLINLFRRNSNRNSGSTNLYYEQK